MNLWIDTEFNGYKGRLLSIALVDETGREFYEVLTCPEPLNAWVEKNVVPVLAHLAVRRDEVQARLARWIKPYNRVCIISDWPEDIQYFCELLVTGPGERIDTPPLRFEIVRGINSDASEIPHNALSDARAIKASHLHHVMTMATP